MKQLFLLGALIMLIWTSQAQAGLFEYYLTGKGTSNTSQAEKVDAVESINVGNGSVYQKTYSVSGNASSLSKYDLDPFARLNSTYSYYKYPTLRDYHYSGFYYADELEENLEDEKDDLENELDCIEDIKRDMKDRIQDAKRYTTSYYRNLRERLEDDLEALEDRKEDIKDRIDDIEDELKDLQREGRSSRYSLYYDYYGSRYYDYDDYNYCTRYSDCSDDRVPYWVNPDLEPVNDGHIYIK